MNDEAKDGVLILVADDDEDIRELVRLRLEQSGFDVICAGDGREALEMAGDRHPDLMLLDIMMPHLDGLEVTRRIRADDEISSTPVILLTASVHGSAKAAGIEAGANAYVRKPFLPEDLLSRVRALLPTASSS